MASSRPNTELFELGTFSVIYCNINRCHQAVPDSADIVFDGCLELKE
jgi:hypothetical protein